MHLILVEKSPKKRTKNCINIITDPSHPKKMILNKQKNTERERKKLAYKISNKLGRI